MASAQRAKAPVIIKRIEAAGEGGHHGGAWKVAYADFVTAMMAFFLLMWLLNATTEEQKHGLADYFSPAITKTPGAGPTDGQENAIRHAIDAPLPDSDRAGDFDKVAQAVQDALTGTGAESMQMKNLLKHVVTRMTDEGLVIEVSDLTDQPLFIDDTAQPTEEMTRIAGILARVLRHTRNQLAVAGHVRAYPEMLVASPVWALSDARAHALRNLMEGRGMDDARFDRVTGYADRRNRSSNPMDPANNRIEVILLR